MVDASERHPQSRPRAVSSPRFSVGAPVFASVVPFEVHYYALTDGEIENFRRFSWLVSTTVALGFMLIEAAFGCWLTLRGEISSANATTIEIVGWVTGVLGIALLIFGGVFAWCNYRSKKHWLSQTLKVEDPPIT